MISDNIFDNIPPQMNIYQHFNAHLHLFSVKIFVLCKIGVLQAAYMTL